MSLSTHHRSQNLAKATEKQFDVVVIGGGITGAGIALDAAARGLSVLLLEKYDFAGGTSSKSTKLIHGGLRYLKQLEFGLVRTVGIERAIIHRLAPHLVEPINMLLPIYKNGSLGKFSTGLALRVYDTLAKVKKEDQYYLVDATQMMQLEPLLNQQTLLGGAIYKEFRTDDARLTISILKTASQYGATCINYAKVEAFEKINNRISGVCVRDLISGKTYSCKGVKIINAAGPWVDDVRGLDILPEGKKLHLTKGIHLVVSKQRFPIQHALYFDVEGDNRMIFVIPRGDMIYMGTTDTNFDGDKDNIVISKADTDYILNAVNKMFPTAALGSGDVLSGWAGLRPLIHEAGKSPSELSRKDEIFIGDNGLISIAGGKLTGYRKMAEKVVDMVAKDLNKSGRPIPKSTTKYIQLFGSDFKMSIPEYIERRTGEAKQINVDRNTINYLVHNYGTGTEDIINYAFDAANEIADAGLRIFTAEIRYCIEHELATNVSDFIIRRSGALYFNIPKARKMYPAVADIIAAALNLDETEKQQQIAFFEIALQQTVSA